MVTMLAKETNTTQFFCIGVGGSGGWLTSPNLFDPDKLDLDNWLQAAVAFGSKYAVLTAQHCSGYSMWPTNIIDESGFEYKFSTRYSSFRGGGYDVVRDFVNSCRKYGVEPGIYYSLNQNYYLNVGRGLVLNSTLVPGQAKVSQEQYGKIVVAQMRELWTNYGDLSELWFDGGCSVPGIADQVADMLEELQPHAIYFQGCGTKNTIHWIGTESGTPKYPIWSTSNGCAVGQGQPDGDTFCPAETDTTTQEFDRWFWRPGFPIRNLSELQNVYYHSVGQNTNLLLNAAANSSGLMEDSTLAVYQAFGSWVKECFSKPVVSTSGHGYMLSLSLKYKSKAAFLFNNIVVQEEQAMGELVVGFAISAFLPDGEEVVLVGDGAAVGNRFARFVGSQTATEVVLTVTGAHATPTFTEFSVYNCTM